jgi:hypothetical protein
VGRKKDFFVIVVDDGASDPTWFALGDDVWVYSIDMSGGYEINTIGEVVEDGRVLRKVRMTDFIKGIR